MDAVQPVAISEIRAAQRRLTGAAMRVPLLRCEDAPSGSEIFLKLENLQPVGSFKIRPVGNAVLARPRSELTAGLYTASSGNSALGVAWWARQLGIGATAFVPENASQAKCQRLSALDASIITLPFADWWHCIETAGHDRHPGLYIDAVRDPAALAGDGTIGVEIVEDLPDVEAIFVPFGGGGLASGIACAAKALRPEVKVIACELNSASPLAAAFAAGRAVTVPYSSGYVSGAGYGSVLPEMWPLVHSMIDGTLSVSLDQVSAAIRALALRDRVIAEGAGAISVAAALFAQHGYRKVCAVVSGGNLDGDLLTAILQGRTPG